MSVTENNWYELNDPERVVSPALLVYPERIVHNIELMIEMVGDVNRLRPHIKTHKTAEIILLQMERGIDKFKCATIAEAELLGICGAKDVLLAMQPVGANIQRLVQLMNSFPQTSFSTLVDDLQIAEQLAQVASQQEVKISLFIDLNTGMNRTGIIPDEKALKLYRSVWENPHLQPKGLHTYDGHIRNQNLEERKRICDAAFELVLRLKSRIEDQNMDVPAIVAGGSPSFPIHAQRQGIEVSPGTTLLWDERYGSLFKEMGFLPAAVLLSRIISKPKGDLICLDLGHKSIAPEMDFPRVKPLGMEECTQISQSEEHLVVRSPDTSSFQIGDPCYAIPMHICPTVAKYPFVHVVEEGNITGRWEVAARNHVLTI